MIQCSEQRVDGAGVSHRLVPVTHWQTPASQSPAMLSSAVLHPVATSSDFSCVISAWTALVCPAASYPHAVAFDAAHLDENRGPLPSFGIRGA